MRHSIPRVLPILLLTLGLVSATAPVEAQSRGQLFARITNQAGEPVEGLTPDKFVVQEGGTNMTLIAADPGSTPMKIAVLIDNSEGLSGSALGLLRGGLQAFFEALPGEHEVGMYSIAGGVQEVQDFTADKAVLDDAADGLFGGRGGSRMIEGLLETWERRFSEDDSWPVFVVVSTDGPETSRNVAPEVFNDFVIEVVQRAGTFHVLVVSSQGGGVQTQVGQNLAQNTGGVYNSILVASGLPKALEEMAVAIGEHFDAMSDRYRLVYERPGDEPGGAIGAGVAGGLNMDLFADRRLPQQ